MKREDQLRRKLQTLGALSEAVGAMKSLAALHFRSARAMVPSARSYQEGVDLVLTRLDLPPPLPSSAPKGLLVVAADLGLCGDYNSRLAAAGVAERARLGPGPMYCLGCRAFAALRRAGHDVDRTFSTPTSVAGLTDLLLQVVHDVLADQRSGKIGGLDVVSARFEGAGKFAPVCRQLLPIEPARRERPFRPTRYASPSRLAAVAIREFVYITLYQILLESLASEHGARLVAAESAAQWLDARCEESRRTLSNLRREAATQEVLDIAAGARPFRRRESRN